MTEDDTFNKLKGLTWREADELYVDLYRKAMDSSTTITVGDVDDYINNRLRPYGWTIDAINQLRP